MRALINILVLSIMVIVFIGCDKDSQPIGNNLNESPDIIDWVGTEYIYTDIDGKADLSMLLFGTDWCTYCEAMKRQAFKDSVVARILRESFNAVQVNAESDTQVVYYDSTVSGYQMARLSGVIGYPTILFFDENAEMIYEVIGYRTTAQFVEILNDIVENR